jgi:hypothetical protein
MYRCNRLPPVLPIGGLDFEEQIVYKITLRCRATEIRRSSVWIDVDFGGEI